MWRWADKSITRLAWLSALGGLISSLSFVFLRAVGLPYEKHHPGAAVAIGILLFGLLIGGFVFSTMAESRIGNGIAAERWPEAEIDSFRKLMRSRWWVAAMLAGLALFLSAIFARPHSPLHAYAWVGFIVTMNISRLSNAVRAPRTDGTPRPPVWRNLLPLRSDHWGQR